MHRLYVLGIAFGKIIDISNVNNLVSGVIKDLLRFKYLWLTDDVNVILVDLLDTVNLQRV